MEWTLEQLLTPPPIMGTTINTIVLGVEVRIVIYAAICISFIVALLFFLHSKNSFFPALNKSVLVSFFASGLLYAVHADLGWATWVVQDFQAFADTTIDERLQKIEGRYYDFVRLAKKEIPATYMLYCGDSDIALRVEYFLLPARKKENSEVVIVLADNEARYDIYEQTLTIGTVRYTNVEPLLMYLPNVYMVKKR